LRSIDNWSDRLLKTLRRFAVRNQTNEARAFYPLRDVACYYGISISSVDRAYSQLEEEGLISRIRGAKTVLQGKAASRRLMVRGFIGMPVYLPHFITLHDYRSFLIEARQEFWRRGFVTSHVFFEPFTSNPSQLADMIKHRSLDTVIWHAPGTLARETVLILRDRGVHVVGINADNSNPPIRCQYRIQREAALATILDDWQADRAIESIRVVQGPRESARAGAELEEAIEERSIPFETVRLATEGMDSFFKECEANHHAGVILLSMAAAFLCCRAPERLLALSNSRRIALLHGLVSVPFAQPPKATFDLIAVDWGKVAGRIVSDQIAKRTGDSVNPTIFEAQAFLRTVSQPPHRQ
jgi:hypothetical protein